ncbi:MAG: bud emergence protein 1 [Sporothrix epigloea]
MKALRRSIKGDKDAKPHNPIAPKSAVAIVPPKKVIRALYDYEAQSSQELSFSRGDFFHVISRENDPEWYDACNPALPDARGLVPVSFFQALGRTERDSAQSDSSRSGQNSGKNPDHDSGYAETSASGTTDARSSASAAPPQPSTASKRESGLGKNSPMVYGIVMYDFQAERADELEAKAGEAIIVIAQSNPEWFVAKPIGRLGGPGLIPVSFVEIRDMASNTPVPNPQEAVRRANIPKVEEWKKMAADYKNSSITLGKFEVSGSGQQGIEQGIERMSLQQSGQATGARTSQNGYSQGSQGYNMQRNTQQNAHAQQQAQAHAHAHAHSHSRSQSQVQQAAYNGRIQRTSQLYAPKSAHISKYCYAEEKYWFIIDAVLENGRRWELARYYEDFYDFQIALLTEFPVEAGNGGTKKRTLPYMPGPVNYVTNAITEGRLHNLNAYVNNLLAQPLYISRCELVKQFFCPRDGDTEMEPALDEEHTVLDGSQSSATDAASSHTYGSGGYTGQSQQQQPAMVRQPSSLSQPSQSSLVPGMNSQPMTAQAIKIKLSFNNELIAIRVPSDIQFRDLCDKIRDRLKISVADQMQLYYKDDATGEKPAMISNNDLDTAMQRNEKLLIYVEIS